MGWAGGAEGGQGARGLKAGDVIGRTGLPLSRHIEPLDERETGEGVLAFGIPALTHRTSRARKAASNPTLSWVPRLSEEGGTQAPLSTYCLPGPFKCVGTLGTGPSP